MLNCAGFYCVVDSYIWVLLLSCGGITLRVNKPSFYFLIIVPIIISALYLLWLTTGSILNFGPENSSVRWGIINWSLVNILTTGVLIVLLLLKTKMYRFLFSIFFTTTLVSLVVLNLFPIYFWSAGIFDYKFIPYFVITIHISVITSYLIAMVKIILDPLK